MARMVKIPFGSNTPEERDNMSFSPIHIWASMGPAQQGDRVHPPAHGDDDRGGRPVERNVTLLRAKDGDEEVPRAVVSLLSRRATPGRSRSRTDIGLRRSRLMAPVLRKLSLG